MPCSTVEAARRSRDGGGTDRRRPARFWSLGDRPRRVDSGTAMVMCSAGGTAVSMPPAMGAVGLC